MIRLAGKQMVPVSATYNRNTGEIRIDWAENAESFRRFGEIMRKIGRDYQAALDAEARAEYEEKKAAGNGTGRRDGLLL